MSTKSKNTKRKAEVLEATNEDVGDLPKQKKQKLNPTEEAPKNAKIEEKNSTDNSSVDTAVEQIELPPEILVSIFSQLEAKELSSVSRVSQHWWLCARDETLAWSILSPIELVEQTISYNTLRQS